MLGLFGDVGRVRSFVERVDRKMLVELSLVLNSQRGRSTWKYLLWFVLCRA